MKTGHSRIQITNPCSEQWEAMGITAAGRFCEACSKNVIDFSSKSDEEIKAYLLERKDEAICGRFYRKQIDRIRIEIDPALLSSGIPFWQKFLVVVLVCFGSQCFGIDFCFAQTTDSLNTPAFQADSLIAVPRDTLAADTLTQDTLSLSEPADPAADKPEVGVLLFAPGGIVSGNVCIVPEEEYILGDIFVEKGVDISFPSPELAETPPVPAGSPGIDHPSGKIPRQPVPGPFDEPQNVAIIPPLGRIKRRKRKPPAS